MLRLRSSRLARVAGAAALLAALIGARALAQEDPTDALEDLRAGIDENLQNREPEQVEPTRRDDVPSDRIRQYGRPPGSGAGRTGYISTNVLRPTPKPGVKPAQNAPGTGPPGLPPAAALRSGSSVAAQRKGAAMPSGKVPAGNPTAAASGRIPAAAGAGGPGGANAGIAGPNPRRPKPLAEEDAFAPLGVRAGVFLLRPALEITTGHDSNPARVSDARGSALVIVAPELKVNSDWERHELTANIRGSYSDYPSVPLVDRPFLDAKVDGRIDVTRDTRIDLETRYILSTENPGSPNLQAGLAKLPIYTDIGGIAGIDRRFNRLDISLKGTLDRFDYRNSLLTDGTSSSNKDRDYNQYGVQARAGYEITPGLKPFIELDADARVHDLSLDRFGFDRDSDALTPKAGTTFEITRKLTGEISVGYLTRTYKDPRLADLRGLIADASLVWTATGLTSVKLTASSAADESTVPGVSGLFRRDAGIEVDHAFRRWLLGTLKVGWGLDDYVGLDREDRRYSASLGLVYKLSREMQLKGELRQAWLRSNVSGVDYTATAILVGLRLQR
jgi:hypothetical protein